MASAVESNGTAVVSEGTATATAVAAAAAAATATAAAAAALAAARPKRVRTGMSSVRDLPRPT